MNNYFHMVVTFSSSLIINYIKIMTKVMCLTLLTYNILKYIHFSEHVHSLE